MKKQNFKYRCMNCDETKNDQGVWVHYNNSLDPDRFTPSKVCKKCAKHFEKCEKGEL